MSNLDSKEIPNPFNFQAKELNYFKTELKKFIKDKKSTIYQYYGSIFISYPLELTAFTYISSHIFTIMSQKNIDINKLVKYIIIFVTLYGLSMLFRIYKDYIEATTIPLLIRHFRENIFNNILLKLKKQDASLKIGDIISRFITIPTSIRDIITDTSVLIIPKLFKVLIIILISLYVNFKVGMINLLTLIIITILLYYKNIQCFKYHYLNNETFNEVSQVLQNKLYNIFNIIISNNIKQEIKDNKKREKEVYNIYLDSKKCSWNTNLLVNIVLGINAISILYIIVKSLITNTIKSSYAITCIVLISHFIPNIITIVNMIPFTINNYANLLESGEFINFISSFSNVNGKKHNIYGDIVIRNLDFKYAGSKTFIFKKLNITIKKNSSIMIIGKSGTGKSTLMKLLCGFFTTKKDTITFNGKDINKIDVEDLRRQLGLMSQNIRMFEDSILNNIKYSNPNIKEEDIYNFINKYELKVYQNINNNLDTKILPNETNISGGQKQFAILMRLILSNKKVLILDEPTSALDDYHFEVVKKILADLKGKRTIIVISHDNRFQKSDFDHSYALQNQLLIEK